MNVKQTLLMAHRIKQDCDELSRQFEINVHKAENISCNGCRTGYCCHQLLICFMHEALIIAAELLGMSGNHFAPNSELRHRLIEDIFDRYTMESDQMSYLKDAKRVEDVFSPIKSVSRNWMRKKVPCVFLHKGFCRIYPIRPLACSTYWVFSPRMLCSPHGDAEAIVKTFDNKEVLFNAFNANNAMVIQAMKEDAPAALVPMPLSISVVSAMSILMDGWKNFKSKLATM